MIKSGSEAHRSLLFDCARGGDIGRSLMVATNKLFLLLGRTACCLKYNSLFGNLAHLCLSGSYQILHIPHLGTFFLF